MNETEQELTELEDDKKKELAALLLLFLKSKAGLTAILMGLPILNKQLEKFILASRKAAGGKAGQGRGTELARRALILGAIYKLTGALAGHVALDTPADSAVDQIMISNGNRIITTEIFQAYNDSILKSLDKDEKVQWISALEKNTCQTCESYHGNIYTKESCPELPAHNNCKCYLEKV